MTTHRIIFGDAQRMDAVEDESVHLVVTSPPYWCIKDYGHTDQIGHDQTYEEYLSALGNVIGESHRVLHPGCRMAINIGDQYLRASEHGRYRVQPIPADLSVVGREIGFDFMGNIIWHKISTTKTTGGCSLMGSMYYPKDGHVVMSVYCCKRGGHGVSCAVRRPQARRGQKGYIHAHAQDITSRADAPVSGAVSFGRDDLRG